MKNLNLQREIFKYYKKEMNSFIGYLNNVKNVTDEKSIHQLRVTVKRLRAAFNLLQLLLKKEFNAKKHYHIIKPVFKSAGKIREIQINSVCFNRYKLSPFLIEQYKLFYSVKEEADKIKLKKMITTIEVNLLDESKNKMKKLLKEVDDKTISGQCQSFIREKLQQIEQLIHIGNYQANIHKIRIHIKSLGAIVFLFYKINPSAELKQLQSLIKKNAALLGNWHDKVILTKSLKTFSTQNKELSKDDLLALSEVINKIEYENQLLIKDLNSTLNPIFKIAHSISSNKTSVN